MFKRSKLCMWVAAFALTATATGNVLAQESSALTLPDALSLALRQSPALSAFAWDIRAADAMRQQAGLRPNPELAVEIEGVRWTPGPHERTRSAKLSGALAPGALSISGASWEREKGQGAHSGFRESEVTISIGQPIELGRKRAKRVALAEREKELVLWDYQAARADVLAQTAADFVQVLAAQEYVALDEELVGLAEEVVRTFSLRVEAGQVSPLELSRAEIALATTQVAYEKRLGELEVARAILASNWGGKRATFTQAAGRVDAIALVPALDELEARVARNPDLARWSSELAARQAAFKLERAQRIPNLEVELGFRSEALAGRETTQYGFGTNGDFGFKRAQSRHSADRDNSLVLGFSLPLPLFDRNQGRIAAADAMVSKVSDQRRGAEAAAYTQLTAAHHTASAAYLKAQTLRDDVMPKVDEVFDKIQQGYREGKFNYLDVLDSQRTLFDAREAFLDALTRYHRGVVRMERLTGQALENNSSESERDMEAIGHEE